MWPLACILQHIEYAKTKSYATLKREDPDFIPPTSVHAQNTASRLGNEVLANGQKRDREERPGEEERKAKREKTDEDSDEEEMEIDDEDEPGTNNQNGGAYRTTTCLVNPTDVRLSCYVDPQAPFRRHRSSPQHVCYVQISHKRLQTTSWQSCSNSEWHTCLLRPRLRLTGFFIYRYQGFQSTHVVPSPTPNAQGQKCKMAQVIFEAPELATTAKDALDKFMLKKGWAMTVAYI